MTTATKEENQKVQENQSKNTPPPPLNPKSQWEKYPCGGSLHGPRRGGRQRLIYHTKRQIMDFCCWEERRGRRRLNFSWMQLRSCCCTAADWVPPTVPRSSSEISHSIAGQPVGTAEWAGGGGPIHSRVDGCPHRELGIIVWLPITRTQ